ncbi:exosome non-catalytic core subunit rrp46 [Xylographa opegraphella]|nr:exosome non-catalytic core subunit rrp46 [Xylographa opegraphella]
MVSEGTLSPLQRADGSASYSWNGYSVLAAVNGPVDVQRRDELPEEAAVDVIVRPAAGIGGVRERHLEGIIQRTLRHIILVVSYPRKLIQVTLQVTGTPEGDSKSEKLTQASSNLQILPPLLQASVLALISASIPLTLLVTSTLVAVDSHGNLNHNPSPLEIAVAASLHALAFSSQGRLLVAESEGLFDMDTWERVTEEGSRQCRDSPGSIHGEDDVSMKSGSEVAVEGFVRALVREQVAVSQQWNEALR